MVARLTAALEPDDVVIGGGNVKKLKELPAGARAGENDNAFLGGFLLWDDNKVVRGSTVATHQAGCPARSHPHRRHHDELS